MAFIDDIQNKKEKNKKKQEQMAKHAELLKASETSSEAIKKTLAEESDKSRSSVQKVDIQNNLADKQDVDKLISELKETQLASYLSGNKSSVVLADSTDFGEKIDQLSDSLKKVLETEDETPEVVLKAFKELQTTLDSFKSEIKTSNQETVNAVSSLKDSLSELEMSPSISVDAPKVTVPKTDMKPVAEAIERITEAISANQVVMPEFDTSDLSKDIKAVSKAIKDLRFPVPNFKFPFLDTNGSAAQAVLDADGKLQVSGTFSGGGDGAIVDGSNATIKATVHDYTNSNPLAVVLRDTNGDYVSVGGGTQYTEDAASAANPVGNAVNLVRADTPATITTTDGDNVAQRGTNYGAAYTQIVTSGGAFVDTFGGGTQYTEGDTDATITGTAMLMEGAANALVVAQGTAADGLLVNLGANNDITGTVTANLSATDNAVLDAIEADTTTLAGAVSGTEMQVDIVSAPTLTVNAHNVTNAGTFAVQESGAALTSLQLIDDAVYTDGTGTVTKGIAMLGQDGTNPQAIKTDSNGELQVDVLSSALPSGAATSANQTTMIGHLDGVEALLTTIDADTSNLSVVGGGTEAAALRVTIANNSTGVLSVDDNGSTLSIDDGAGSLTVDGTVTANLSATDNAVLDDIALNQTDASQKTQVVDGSGNVIASTANALNVHIASGSSAGTEYTDGDADATPTGSVALGFDGANVQALATDASGNLQVDVLNASIPVTDNGGSLTVDGSVTVSATDLDIRNLTSTDVVTVHGDVGVIDQLDLTNSNPAAVAIVDGDGTQITSFGGGVQYSDADVNADPTGTVAMGTDGSNVYAVHTDTSGDLQVDVLTSALPTGASTAANQATIIGHVDGIEALLTTIDTDTSNIDTSLNAIEASVAAIDTDTTTIIGHLDGVEGLLTTIDADTGSILTAVDGLETSNSAIQTAVQLIDDAVQVLGTDTFTEASSKGITLGAVRRDADTTLVNTTNEFTPLQVDANGRLKVEAFSGETLPVSLTSTTITGTVAVTQSGTWDEIGINDSGNSITVDNPQLSVVGSGTEATAMRVTIATDSTGVLSVDDNGGSLTVDGTVTANLAAGTNNIGDVDVLSVVPGTSATSLGKAEDAAHASGDTGVMMLGVRNDSVNSFTTTDLDYSPISVDSLGRVLVVAGGNVAHDVADAGDPVKMGFKAESSLAGVTLVADADRSNAYGDIDGVAYARPYSLGDVKSDATSNTDGASTASSVFGAVASTKNCIDAIHVFRTDSGTTPIYVDFRDGTAGSVLWRMVIPPNGGAVLPKADMPYFRTSANTALAYDVSAATTTVYINVSGFQSKV